MSYSGRKHRNFSIIFGSVMPAVTWVQNTAVARGISFFRVYCETVPRSSRSTKLNPQGKKVEGAQ